MITVSPAPHDHSKESSQETDVWCNYCTHTDIYRFTHLFRGRCSDHNPNIDALMCSI